MHKMHVPWRTLQIVINVGTIVTSFCTFLPLGYVSQYFTWQCVLYADIRVTNQVNATAIFVDKENTVWGSSGNCSFTTYSVLVVGIHAFIWCWFFMLMKAQLKSENRDFPLLVASFLLHSIMCVVVFVASSMISAGINSWCHNLVHTLSEKSRSLTCLETENLYWPNVFTDGKKHPIYSFLLTAKIASWLQTLTVLCQSVVCGYKLYAWILKTTGGKLDLRKCGRSSSIDTSQCSGGYAVGADSDEEDALHSLGSGDYRRFDAETRSKQSANDQNGHDDAVEQISIVSP